MFTVTRRINLGMHAPMCENIYCVDCTRCDYPLPSSNPPHVFAVLTLFQVLCEHQLGVHAIPIGLLNVCGAYDTLLE